MRTMSRPDGGPPGIGIVHLGIGAFFRAFGLPALQEMMEITNPDGGGDWGVVGVSLRSPSVRDELQPTDFAYHAVELGPGGSKAARIEVLRSVLFLGEDRDAVLDAMMDPGVRIVSVTVTEKGYCYSVRSATADWEHGDMIHDLANPDSPRSAPGLILEALRRRRDRGVAPFSCLSCDNLSGNSLILKRVVTGLAERQDPELARWIDGAVPFPCTMVDRIVPATTAADVASTAELIGRTDPSPVVHEPFRQWVIEDGFAELGRPPLDLVGALFVADVRPYEEMKIRLLNGTHLAIAYLGVLAGKRTVFEAVEDPAFRSFIERLWSEELVPSLADPPDIDLVGYTQALMARYRNPAIAHATIQIAMDGSQKLPLRILAPIADNLHSGRKTTGLSLVVAAWIRYLSGRTDSGEIFEIRDPIGERLMRSARDSADPVAAILQLEEIFDPVLAADSAFRSQVRAAYERLSRDGVQPVLESESHD